MSFDTAISVLLDYHVDCVWNGASQPLSLMAHPVSSARFLFVLAQTAQQREQLQQLHGLNTEQVLERASQFNLVCFDSGLPWKLHPVEVAKPWGKEVWYSGIEQRGVSTFQCDGQSVPIPFLLNAHHTWFLQDHKAPILLKTLVPLPDEVYGDLYLELHEEKQEVYIVTDINPQSWSQGKGAIRLGFNQRKIAEFGSVEEFTAAFRESIKKYRQVRKEIDQIQDRYREQQNIALDAPVTADQQKQWNAMLPDALQLKERQLREAMNQFTDLQPLSLGDVVKVPTLTPHALQHGVSVAEFQTPVYERKILSFAQKVLTQAEWDTDDALNLMVMHAEQPPVKQLHVAEGVKLEEVVSFEDFTVQRLYLEPDAGWQHSAKFYSLIFCIAGELAVDSDSQLQTCLKPGEAAYLCPQWLNITEEGSGTFLFKNHFDQTLVLLLAQPRHYAKSST